MQFLLRHKRVALVAAAVLVTLTALIIFSLPAAKPTSSTPQAAQVLGSGGRLAPGSSSGASLTDTQIEAYQEKLRKSSGDGPTYSHLGLAYLQKAREVGDPTYYSKAEAVFKKALEIDPKNIEAMGGMGSLSLSRHLFVQALDWGEKAKNLSSFTSYNYGVINDALVELGRYDEAAKVLQEMVDLRPDISSYSRISYLRELHGMYNGAVEAMKQAIDAAPPSGENRAFVVYQLGNLYFNHNDLSKAEASYQQALAVYPDYVYAMQGMAQIKAANGDLNGAMALYSTITKRYPLPQFLIEQGDLYNLMGKPEEANRQYDLVRGIVNIASQNGVDSDMEMALFSADHDYKLSEALDQAKKSFAVRASVKGADVLSWTLYKTGDFKGALEASKQSFRIGTQDSLFFYHNAMINLKLGQTAEAKNMLEKALTLNPNFSLLYAKDARKTLESLGGTVASK